MPVTPPDNLGDDKYAPSSFPQTPASVSTSIQIIENGQSAIITTPYIWDDTPENRTIRTNAITALFAATGSQGSTSVVGDTYDSRSSLTSLVYNAGSVLPPQSVLDKAWEDYRAALATQTGSVYVPPPPQTFISPTQSGPFVTGPFTAGPADPNGFVTGPGFVTGGGSYLPVVGAVAVPSLIAGISGIKIPTVTLPSITLPGGFTPPADLVAKAAAATPPAFPNLMTAAKQSLTASVAVTDPTTGQFVPPVNANLFADKSSTLNSIKGSLAALGAGASAAMATITSSIDTAQKNALGDLAVAKAALAQKIKESTSIGQPISQADVSAALAPTTALQNMQSTLSGNPLQAATKMAADAATAASAKTEAINSLKADALLSMLTKPMPVSAAGAVMGNINTSVFTPLAKYSVIKAQETSATQPVASQDPPRDSVRPSGGPLPSDKVTPPITDPDIVNRIWTTEMAGYDKAKEAAYKAAMKILGITVPPDAGKDAVSDAGKALTDSIIPGYQASKAAYTSLLATKPDKTTWTDAENALKTGYEANKEKLQVDPKYTAYTDAVAVYRKIFANYKIAYEAWKNNASRYTLPTEIENDLAYYDPDKMHGISIEATKSASGQLGYKYTYIAANKITGYVRNAGLFSVSYA